MLQKIYSVPKPIIGNFGLANIAGAQVAAENKKEAAQLINAAVMANGGNLQDPAV